MWLSVFLACQEDPETTQTTPTDDGVIDCTDVDRANCVEVAAGDVQTLLDTANTLADDTAIVLAEGTYTLDNSLTIRNVTGITLIGQGVDRTVLDFATVKAQVNGVEAVVNDFHIEGLTIADAKKDGLRIEDSDGIVIRAVKVHWTGGPDSSNGAYGIYPVRVSHVLMENSEAYAASDAGIYVGQCQHAIIRNNIAKQNVAGIEIENTQFADVYGNVAEDNTAGLVAFDLPGNPIIGRDVYIHDNTIVSNNRPNFAPGGTVAQIPAGTGTFALASRRLEITNNTYQNNNTVDIALLSGLVVEGDPAAWSIPVADLEGDVSGLELDGDDTTVQNFRSYDLYIHGNTHAGSGDLPDATSPSDRPLGLLLAAVYAGTVVDTVIYDAIGESSFDPNDPSLNSNDHRVCVGNDTGVTFASLDLENLQNTPLFSMLYRPDPPFAPFDCVGPAILPPTGVL
jgi:parallel beta-helix repeat protein